MKLNGRGILNEGRTSASSQSSCDSHRAKMKALSMPDLTAAEGVASMGAGSFSRVTDAGARVTPAASTSKRSQKLASASSFDPSTTFLRERMECKIKISDISKADFFEQIVTSTMQNLSIIQKPQENEEGPCCTSPCRSPKFNDSSDDDSNNGKIGERSSRSLARPRSAHAEVGKSRRRGQSYVSTLGAQARPTKSKRSRSTGRIELSIASSEKDKGTSTESFRRRRKAQGSQITKKDTSPESTANVASVKRKLRRPASSSMLVDLAISSKANLDISTGKTSPERSANVASVKPKLGRPASASMLVDLAISSNRNIDVDNDMPALNRQKVFTRGTRSNNNSPNSSVSNRRRRGNSPSRVGREQVLQALKHNAPLTVLSTEPIAGDDYENEDIEECHDDNETLPSLKNTSELGEVPVTKTRRCALLCEANVTVSQLKTNNDGNTSTSRLDLALLESLERRSKHSLEPRLNNGSSLQKQAMLKSAPDLLNLKTSQPNLRQSLSRRIEARLTSKPNQRPSSSRNYEWSLNRQPAKKTVSCLKNSKSCINDSLPLKPTSNEPTGLHHSASSPCLI